ncbi:FAD-binding protein [Nocardia carnea]|uniref:FAD-binding protein n=1 Tax=Nocardia carnea TaxID=37328 RepID=A0ABW7TPD0_9NOCA|nr:FAD-binding protein [Nocardia carnea]
MLSRRRLVTSTALGVALGVAGLRDLPAQAAPVVPGEQTHNDLVLRGYNRRFIARPRRIHVPGTAEEARQAVGAAVREGLRPAARSGGHCFEDFVDNSETQVIVDLKRLREIAWDERYRAFAVGAGATLETVYQGWPHGM